MNTDNKKFEFPNMKSLEWVVNIVNEVARASLVLLCLILFFQVNTMPRGNASISNSHGSLEKDIRTLFSLTQPNPDEINLRDSLNRLSINLKSTVSEQSWAVRGTKIMSVFGQFQGEVLNKTKFIQQPSSLGYRIFNNILMAVPAVRAGGKSIDSYSKYVSQLVDTSKSRPDRTNAKKPSKEKEPKKLLEKDLDKSSRKEKVLNNEGVSILHAPKFENEPVELDLPPDLSLVYGTIFRDVLWRVAHIPVTVLSNYLFIDSKGVIWDGAANNFSMKLTQELLQEVYKMFLKIFLLNTKSENEALLVGTPDEKSKKFRCIDLVRTEYFSHIEKHFILKGGLFSQSGVHTLFQGIDAKDFIRKIIQKGRFKGGSAKNIYEIELIPEIKVSSAILNSKDKVYLFKGKPGTSFTIGTELKDPQKYPVVFFFKLPFVDKTSDGRFGSCYLNWRNGVPVQEKVKQKRRIELEKK